MTFTIYYEEGRGWYGVVDGSGGCEGICADESISDCNTCYSHFETKQEVENAIAR